MECDPLTLDPLRECNPQTTLNLLENKLPHIKITRLANITGLDDIGIPVWLAIRPSSKYLCVAQGKGLTDTVAKISAVMESIELLHLENIHLPTLLGSYNQLSNTIPCLNPQQINQGFIVAQNIQQQTFTWLTTTNLINKQSVWLPRELIAMDMTLPTHVSAYFRQNTTGIAAGNTQNEATLKALFEVIERQTLNLWEKNALPDVSALDTDIDDPIIQRTLLRITNSGKQVTLFLLQNPWDIPVYFCEIIDNNMERPIGTCIGSGCHSSHKQAILGAILEAVQTRLTLISGSRDDNYQAFYDNRKNNQPIPCDNYPKQTLTSDMLNDTTLQNATETTLKNIIQTMHDDNITQVLLINHTKPELNIPVSQIIIPGFGSPI